MDDDALSTLEELRREHEQSLRAIRSANLDLEERMRRSRIHVSYDADDDTLLIALGELAQTVTETIGNAIALHVAENDLRIMAIELLDLGERVRQQPDLLSTILLLLQGINTELETVPSERSSREVAGAIRSLVFA